MALPVVNAPKYQLTIPSNGQNISYRPYLVKEEKILMVAMESKDQGQMIQAVKDVIEACTENKIKVNDLPIFDLEYLFLQIRAKSVGETSQIRIKCKECNAPNDYAINLENVKVEGEIKKNFSVQITDDIGVTLKYPTVSSLQHHLKEQGNFAVAMSTIVASIDSIYDKDSVYPAENETRESLNDFLESLNSTQFKKLTEFFNEVPAIRHTVNFKCTGCSEQNTQVVEGLQNFF